MNRILHGDNLQALQGMGSGSVALIYVDPPFNTGKRQTRVRMKTVQDEAGDRVGFGGRRYRTELVETAGRPVDEIAGYADLRFDDFLGFLEASAGGGSPGVGTDWEPVLPEHRLP